MESTDFLGGQDRTHGLRHRILQALGETHPWALSAGCAGQPGGSAKAGAHLGHSVALRTEGPRPCCHRLGTRTRARRLNLCPSPIAAVATRDGVGSSRVWRRGAEGAGGWSRTMCIVPEAAWGRCGQRHRAGIRADTGPFRTCQRGLCLSMHTIFSPKAPYFSPTSQPFSQSFLTSSPGAGTGYEISLPAGYC